jgi:hypothetical protein
LPQARFRFPTDDPQPIAGFALIAVDGGYDRARPFLLGTWNPGDWWPLDTPSGSVSYRSLQ